MSEDKEEKNKMTQARRLARLAIEKQELQFSKITEIATNIIKGQLYTNKELQLLLNERSLFELTNILSEMRGN